MKNNKKTLGWQENKWAWLATGASSLALSYVFASLAIDSGSYWHYTASLLLLWLGVKLLVEAFKQHGKN